MKRILSYEDFQNQEFSESKSIQDIETHLEEENVKITEIRPDGIVATNSVDETAILSKEDILEK
ncbi:hypothetical protein [Flavobacterium johnsoniae]|uniref:hypothetical protein n=1 Tax=Flavobacterium johnsoniae TaxID=986 RepID=UPI0011EC1414|nr:hypothetical protein [Flavobacterium johnsoniae]